MWCRIITSGLLMIFILGFCACSESVSTKPKIRFLDGSDTGGAWQEIIKEFNQIHPEIEVELVEGPAATNTREDMYSTSFLAGEATYDLVYMDIIWVPKFAAAGWLSSLDDYFPKDEQAKFLSGDIAGSRYQEHIYRVPQRTDAGMLYYRKDLLEANQLTPPQTWDELVEICTKLQNPPELWGMVFQAHQYEGLICNFLEILWGAGGKLIDEAGEITINSPESVKALQWMYDLVNKYKIAPPGVTTYQEEETRHSFQDGHAIFMRNWPYAWTLAQKENLPIHGKIGIIPQVHDIGSKSASTLGGWGFGISKFSKHSQESWEFIKFSTSAKGQKLMHFKNGAIPTRHELFKDKDILEESPHYSELYQVLVTARPRPMHPRYAQISDILQVYVSKALVGQQTPAQALAQAEAEIKAVLKRK